MSTNHPDAPLIAALGGPTKVAELLGIDKRGGAQRVQNWITRGIPAHMKVKRPDILMPELAPPPANTAQAAMQSVAQGAAGV